MAFTVEVSRDGNLGEQLSNMRVWLDHKYFRAADFRRSTAAVGRLILRASARRGSSRGLSMAKCSAQLSPALQVLRSLQGRWV